MTPFMKNVGWMLAIKSFVDKICDRYEFRLSDVANVYYVHHGLRVELSSGRILFFLATAEELREPAEQPLVTEPTK